MMASSAYRGASTVHRRSLARLLSGLQPSTNEATVTLTIGGGSSRAAPRWGGGGGGGGFGGGVISRALSSSPSSSFSALPPDEEREEKIRVDSLTPYQREMELRKLDHELARLQTLRGINTGELYTFRGKFKMLGRDYGVGFMAWYWTVWFATAGLSYAAIELGGVDPLIVAGKVENFMGWEATSISGKLDPTLGQIGLVVAVNECLEPLRLPFVVVTTKPVVNFFSKR
ncbi:hypothetical protein ACHAXA_004561 [Cyclostephanos tholiformis]|uniref:DUF1279 domain-containing protein n=1 Tax=Cyclostephanos tholiformis TaxID=382380 RepID=A0ABD3RTC0_9STRA